MPRIKQQQPPNCEVCKTHHPFDLPAQLVEATKNGEVVIFAGAGISTETNTVFKSTLYEDVRSELNIEHNHKLSFSQLMTEFCKQQDGRRRLLSLIKKRFDYLLSFPELYRTASRFHHELSTIHHITEIITTNWDTLFESACGAGPIIIPEDFVFWDNPMRKVLKLHGSINNLGTIIATEDDYN